MDYKVINKDLWNKWAKLHINSDFYDIENFKKGQTSLKSIELDLLNDIKGKSVLHLQCHFGQDTLSLSRMGSKATGVDISDEAMKIGNELATDLSLDTQFVCSDVLELDKNLEGKFDYVFTSYGALIWLPDLTKWAEIVNHFLKPGGKLIVVEFHPVSNMYNEDFSKIQYSYFFRGEGVLESSSGSYAEPEAIHIKGESISWDYSISELMTPILQQGLTIESFKEYDYSPYNIYQNSVKIKKGYQVQGLEGKIPLVYSLVASKRK